MATVASTRHLVLAIIDGGVWALWSAGCGYVAHRLAPATLARDGPLRLRPAERGGRIYERLVHIRAWKDALPEAGSLFRGGFSKRRLVRHDHAYLEQFVLETRRAELAHWAILALSPVFFAWNPWWLAVAMLAYGLAANLPCVLVQRYNRARIQQLLDRATARAVAPPSP